MTLLAYLNWSIMLPVQLNILYQKSLGEPRKAMGNKATATTNIHKHTDISTPTWLNNDWVYCDTSSIINTDAPNKLIQMEAIVIYLK